MKKLRAGVPGCKKCWQVSWRQVVHRAVLHRCIIVSVWCHPQEAGVLFRMACAV